MKTILNDGVMEALICPSNWVFVRWIQNKHGRLQKRLIKDLNAIEKIVLTLRWNGWFTASEISHTDFHKLLRKFGAKESEKEGDFQYFIKPITGEGDLHVQYR